MDRQILREELTRDEGDVRKPYKDSVGILTIGVGHNLEAKPLSDLVVRVLLDEDIDEAVSMLNQHVPWWMGLNDVRQRALVNMAFNLGGRLLHFKNFLAALEARNYEKAAAEMEDSRWWSQVGARAVRLRDMILRGEV